MIKEVENMRNYDLMRFIVVVLQLTLPESIFLAMRTIFPSDKKSRILRLTKPIFNSLGI